MTTTDPNADQAPESVDPNDLQGPRRERPDWQGDPAAEPVTEPAETPTTAPTPPPPAEPPKPKA